MDLPEKPQYETKNIVYYIEPHQVGVVVNGQGTQILQPGRHLWLPGRRVALLNTNVNDIGSEFSALTNDNLRISGEYSLGVRVSSPNDFMDKAPINYGSVVDVTARSELKKIIRSSYSMEKTLEQKSSLENDLQNILQKRLNSFGLQVTYVTLGNIILEAKLEETSAEAYNLQLEKQLIQERYEVEVLRLQKEHEFRKSEIRARIEEFGLESRERLAVEQSLLPEVKTLYREKFKMLIETLYELSDYQRTQAREDYDLLISVKERESGLFTSLMEAQGKIVRETIAVIGASIGDKDSSTAIMAYITQALHSSSESNVFEGHIKASISEKLETTLAEERAKREASVRRLMEQARTDSRIDEFRRAKELGVDLQEYVGAFFGTNRIRFNLDLGKKGVTSLLQTLERKEDSEEE